MKKLLPILMLSFLTTVPACAAEILPLSVSYPAPLTVQIDGPQELVTRSGGYTQGQPIGGCGYEISWGDGQRSPETGSAAPYCRDSLTHIYAAAGPYTIEVHIYDPGPTDDPVNERSGTLNITVK